MKPLPFLLLLTLFFLPSQVLGQDGERVSNDGVSIEKRGGWVVGEATGGVVVRLDAAGESTSRIEVRAARGVKSERAATFFDSFHASLLSAGFERIREPQPKTYGTQGGKELEYEAKQGSDRVFRVVIWQLHRGDSAWLFVGRFERDERDTLYRDFTAILATVVFEE